MMVELQEGITVPLQLMSYAVDPKPYPIQYRVMKEKEVKKMLQKKPVRYEELFDAVYKSVALDEQRRLDRVALFMSQVSK